MAKKKPTSKPAKKVAAKPLAKKAAVKKASPAKTPSTKKAAVKKPSKPIQKVAPKKAASAKKAVPAKKAVKSASPKKSAQKPSAPLKKAPVKAAPKKAVAKKVEPIKKGLPTKKAVSAPTAAPAKVAPPKAEAPKPKRRNRPSRAKGAMSSEPKTPSRPLVTQGAGPIMPRVTPMVKKHVSTLEAGDKDRYTDQDLEEFRSIINTKLEEARKDYDLLKQTLANTDNNGTEDTSPSFKMIEDGSETLGREETAQLAGRQEKFIKHLEDALLRIRNKTYGICRVTGKLISKERLRLVPHATLSIEAKQQMGS